MSPKQEAYFKPSKIILFFIAVFCLMTFSFLGIMPVSHAAGGLNISTPFPGVTVKAAENVDFAIRVDNTSGAPQNVGLQIASLPEGWEGYFEGNGNQVSRVYVKNSDFSTVTFNAKMPANTAEGSYKISLKADAGNGVADTLDLELNVSKTEMTQGKFTSQFPELQGPNTAAFKFSVNLNNNSSKEQSYSLSSKASEGWEVSFTPSYDNKQIASLSLEAGKSQGMDVTITPPKTVKAGKYTIPCAAVSADETLKMDLTVIITGAYGLEMTTPDGLLNMEAYAGRETPVTIVLTNTGSADLKDISLGSSVAQNWSVRFEKASIDTLPAGNKIEVKAYVQPGPNVITGDYAAAITANTVETNAQIAFRVAVKTSTAWGIIGVVIILALIFALVWVFRKFGRR